MPVWGGALGAVLVGLLIWASWGKLHFGADPDVAGIPESTEAQYVSAFVDLPGDPLTIRLSDDAGMGRTTRRVARPADLDPTRVVSDLIVVSDVMVSTEERFLTTLPSTQEDFAFFRAQRSGGANSQASLSALREQLAPQAGASKGSTEIDDSEAGWGETLDNTTEALPAFQETAVENTTSVTFVRPEDQRKALYESVFVRITAPRSLEDVLRANGVSNVGIGLAMRAGVEYFGRTDLIAGDILAMRLADVRDDKYVAQLSLYEGTDYVGSIARDRSGRLSSATDPWIDKDLSAFVETDRDDAVSPQQKYRMLDAFYSAAIRNRMPASLVGEAILLLSRAHDLNAFANPGDRMLVLYAQDPAPDEIGPGQVMYIALQGQEIDIECFVFAETKDNYRCFGAQGAASSGGRGLINGMATPVQGVMTSTFGPRNHPILNTVRIHKGVDWAAPIGTPVYAAFKGKVTFMGNGGDYGNLVRIMHENGFETRYAHLNAFAEGLQNGQNVRAGQQIGEIGTTGLSTGPHLHFELRLDGDAVDPLSGGAIDMLVNRIIRVESAGVADARNPNSTATGLGQFIDSTWLRMMRTYRPDLATTLPREELLALRTDPTISRQMVTNLARENEAYLRARGHAITAGRLYLAHFLGAEGAHAALSAPSDADLEELFGRAVIAANSFLEDRDAAYVIAWAEGKMRGRGGRGGAALPPEPAGLSAFRRAIQEALGTT